MGRVDQDQKHGDLPVGLEYFPVGASLLAMTASAAMKYLALLKQEAVSVYGRFSAVPERARIAP